MIWSEIKTALRSADSILISAHVNPDGDCIGAQLALYRWLADMGKDVVVYNKKKPPKKFCFMADSGVITDELTRTTFDVFVILDSSYPSRLGWDTTIITAPVMINIDHHRDNWRGATLNAVDPTAAATSLLLYSFFNLSDIEMSPAIAEALYTGILTDTGGFQFSNTSAEVLRAAADLIDHGVCPQKVYKLIYASHTPQGLELRSRVASTVSFLYDRRFCFMEMDSRWIDEMGANYGDVEGMSDQTLTAEGVLVGCLIKYDGTETHFSLRSTGEIDVGMIAKNIPGGGGHACAAGCSIIATPDVAKPLIFGFIEKELTRS